MAAAPQSRTTVLHLLRFDDWGGTEVQVARLAAESQDSDVHQAVAILAPAGPIRAMLDTHGVEAYSLAGSLGITGSVLRLALLLRRRRFALVEAYGFRAGLIARAACLLAGGRRLLIGVRGMHFAGSEDLDGGLTRFVIAVERLLSWSVAAYDANSHGARDFLVGRGLPVARFRVIPNGVETDVPQAVHGARPVPVIVCVARFVRGKRHDVLIRALALLKERGVPFRCELVGDGPWHDPHRQLASDLGVFTDISFSGRLPVNEVRGRLAAADVFALCSVWEGSPGSILEAMVAGLPVVGSDVPGIVELVDDGTTGMLVPFEDVRALADALASLLSDVDQRRSMGEAGRARAETRYSIERMVAAKLALFRDLAA